MKRAIGAHGLPLEVIVATEVEASHLKRLAELRGWSCAMARGEDHIRVTLGTL